MTARAPRILLHLGASKCGTTSLQGFLGDHDAALRAQGILRPNIMRVGINDAAAGAFMGMPPQIERFMRWHGLQGVDASHIDAMIEEAFLREIEEDNPHTVLLTFEGFLPRSLRQIEKLMGLLAKVSTDISTITAVRRHDRWAISSYNTRLVGHGTATRNMLLHDSGQRHGIRYCQQLDAWRQATGASKTKVFAFEDFDDILVPYLEAIGFAAETRAAPVRNKGLSAYSQEVLRRYNEITRDKGLDVAMFRNTRHRLKAVLPRGEPMLPSAQDVAAHLGHFEADIDQLRGSYLPETSKFFSDLKPYPETCQAIRVPDSEIGEWVQKAEALNLEADDEPTLTDAVIERQFLALEEVSRRLEGKAT